LISKIDQMIKMKTEDVKEIFGDGLPGPIPGPHFGGLITDPTPGRLRKLEERVKVLEEKIEFLYNSVAILYERLGEEE
jgi:hypothetical protein